ncbi:MAG TPA: CAP domain-containing protein, partial [Burkholderiales bacterium]|nr:CAP domain-containing protein [Burkholderiales bacterium]
MKHPERPRSRPSALVLLAAGLISLACVVSAAAASGRQASLIPDPFRVEKDLLAILNRERAAHGLPTVRLASSLVGLARKHSAEMARTNVLGHDSAGGKSYTDRLVDAGILFAANGENVAQSWSPSADSIHQSFMNSPGHRSNVLNRDFDEVGIGIVR